MLPRVILHNAVSVDGRTDWFMPDIGLFYELAGTWKEDATLAGSETICKPTEPIPPEDDSVFTPPVVAPDDRRPLLVIPDSRGRVRHWHALRQAGYWRDHVALCSRATPQAHLDYLGKRHVKWVLAGEDRVDLRTALKELSARFNVKVVRVDSGGTLNGALLRAGLVHEISVLIHPNLVGGFSPASLFRALDLTAPDGVIPLRLTHVERLKDDIVWLRYEVARAA